MYVPYSSSMDYQQFNETLPEQGLLGWLDSEMTPSRPQIVLDKQIGPKQWDIWKLAASTEELGT